MATDNTKVTDKFIINFIEKKVVLNLCTAAFLELLFFATGYNPIFS